MTPAALVVSPLPLGSVPDCVSIGVSHVPVVLRIPAARVLARVKTAVRAALGTADFGTASLAIIKNATKATPAAAVVRRECPEVSTDQRWLTANVLEVSPPPPGTNAETRRTTRTPPTITTNVSARAPPAPEMTPPAVKTTVKSATRHDRPRDSEPARARTARRTFPPAPPRPPGRGAGRGTDARSKIETTTLKVLDLGAKVAWLRSRLHDYRVRFYSDCDHDDGVLDVSPSPATISAVIWT